MLRTFREHFDSKHNSSFLRILSLYIIYLTIIPRLRVGYDTVRAQYAPSWLSSSHIQQAQVE